MRKSPVMDDYLNANCFRSLWAYELGCIHYKALWLDHLNSNLEGNNENYFYLINKQHLNDEFIRLKWMNTIVSSNTVNAKRKQKKNVSYINYKSNLQFCQSVTQVWRHQRQLHPCLVVFMNMIPWSEQLKNL